MKTLTDNEKKQEVMACELNGKITKVSVVPANSSIGQGKTEKQKLDSVDIVSFCVVLGFILAVLYFIFR